MDRKTEAAKNDPGKAPGPRKQPVFRFVGALVLLAVVSLAIFVGVWGLLRVARLVAAEPGGAAGIPLQINHQGVVMVDGNRFDGTGEFRFALVRPDMENNLWTNDGTNVGTPAMPTAAVSLPVEKGIYSVRLGNTDLVNMTAIPTTVFDTDNVVLRIWFDDMEGNGVERLTADPPDPPDHVLTSAPYAYRAAHATTADNVSTLPLPSGVIVMWSGSIADIPDGWALCDGTNGTPDLTSRFIRSVPNASTDPGSTGGSSGHAHGAGSYTASSHTHTYSGTTSQANALERCESGDPQVCARINHSHTYSGTTNPGAGGPITGTSAEATSLPPYYELAFIMNMNL